MPRARRQLWVIAAPKSGSTWLTAILENYLGWELRSLTSSFDRREQEPSLRALADSMSAQDVLWKHQHTRFSKATIELIRRARIWPIIQTRNLHDTVISLLDHFNHESTTCAMAYMDRQHWGQLDDEAKLQFIIDLAMPWYFNFYAGWFTSPLLRDKIACQCRYEDLRSDPCAELNRICRHFDLPFHPQKASSAIERTASQFTRLNRGVAGRGARLSERQKETLDRMRRYYVDVDFSTVGIPGRSQPVFPGQRDDVQGCFSGKSAA
ncbi:MAG: sulfotransferase domain-containing protein [Planctomycetaceae bacterium]